MKAAASCYSHVHMHYLQSAKSRQTVASADTEDSSQLDMPHAQEVNSAINSDCDDVISGDESDHVYHNSTDDSIQLPQVTQGSVTFESLTFQNWLTGPDGSQHNLRSATQHARHVRTILSQVGGEQCSSDLLLDRVCIKDKFLGEYVVKRQYQPGTINSHLSSLGHLYIRLLAFDKCVP